eukprot:1020172-Amphidinium_carterae.2
MSVLSPLFMKVLDWNELSASLVKAGLCCLGAKAKCPVWGSRHLRAGVFGVANPDSEKVRKIIDRRRKNSIETSIHTALHERGRKRLVEQLVHELRRYMTLPHALQLAGTRCRGCFMSRLDYCAVSVEWCKQSY